MIEKRDNVDDIDTESKPISQNHLHFYVVDSDSQTTANPADQENEKTIHEKILNANENYVECEFSLEDVKYHNLTVSLHFLTIHGI